MVMLMRYQLKETRPVPRRALKVVAPMDSHVESSNVVTPACGTMSLVCRVPPVGCPSTSGERNEVSTILASLYRQVPLTADTPASVVKSIVAKGASADAPARANESAGAAAAIN